MIKLQKLMESIDSNINAEIRDIIGHSQLMQDYLDDRDYEMVLAHFRLVQNSYKNMIKLINKLKKLNYE